MPFLNSEKDKDKDKDKKRNEGGSDPTDFKPVLFVVDKDFNRKKPFYINENNIHTLKFPKCCCPIPGDDAMGFIDNKNHIEVHHRDCDVGVKLKSSFGNRIIDVKWDMHRTMLFDATIRLKGIDQIGLLIFEGIIELRVHDKDDVQVIIDSLSSIKGLEEAQRLEKKQ